MKNLDVNILCRALDQWEKLEKDYKTIKKKYGILLSALKYIALGTRPEDSDTKIAIQALKKVDEL